MRESIIGAVIGGVIGIFILILDQLFRMSRGRISRALIIGGEIIACLILSWGVVGIVFSRSQSQPTPTRQGSAPPERRQAPISPTPKPTAIHRPNANPAPSLSLVVSAGGVALRPDVYRLNINESLLITANVTGARPTSLQFRWYEGERGATTISGDTYAYTARQRGEDYLIIELWDTQQEVTIAEKNIKIIVP